MTEMTREERIAEFFKKRDKIIDEQGLFIMGVAGDSDTPPFAYTVGLSENGYPEMFIQGVSHQIAAETINRIHVKLKEGHSLKDGDEFELDAKHDEDNAPYKVMAKEIEVKSTADLRERDLLSMAQRIGEVKPQFRGLYQLVWQCRDYHYPWEEGYSATYDQGFANQR